MKNKSVFYSVLVAMLSAVALVLYLLEFPVLAALPHLKLDLSDIPALMAGVVLGPGYGILVELIKNLLEMSFKGLGTQLGFGNIMNFIVGCAYIVPFSLVFRYMHKKRNKYLGAILLSSLTGIISILVLGLLGNYIIAPLFFKYFMSIELSDAALWGAIWGATVINAIKGVMLSVVSYPTVIVLKKAMERVLGKE